MRPMLKILPLLAALLVFAAAPLAAGVAAEDTAGDASETAIRDAVQDVIRYQNAAFRRDDGETAFAFAAPLIQKRFGTPTVFLEMVKTAYPQVYRPAEVEFREFVMVDGTPVQRVLYVGADASTVIAHYAFEKHADGSWRIMHVALLASKEKAI